MLTAKFKHLDLEPGDRVLDLGCGEGRHVHGLHMLEDVHAVGADLDEPSLRKALDGLMTLPPSSAGSAGFARADAARLPFADEAFDAVICSEVLEHLIDPAAALTEIRRVLKPDGRLCVSVPRAWPERLCWRLAPNDYPFQPGGHIRIYDAVELRCAVERHGFTMRRRHHAHGLHAPYWWLKCLFWRADGEVDHLLPRAYHRMLVWDVLKRPWLTRAFDAILTPLMGKSLVVYFDSRGAR